MGGNGRGRGDRRGGEGREEREGRGGEERGGSGTPRKNPGYGPEKVRSSSLNVKIRPFLPLFSPNFSHSRKCIIINGN